MPGPVSLPGFLSGQILHTFAMMSSTMASSEKNSLKELTLCWTIQKQKSDSRTWMQWFMPVTPERRRQRSETLCELEANLEVGEGRERERGRKRPVVALRSTLFPHSNNHCFLPTTLFLMWLGNFKQREPRICN